MQERALIILKTDAVLRGLTGKITDRLETKGLKLVACKMSTISEEVLKEHYAHIASKPFFPSVVDYMTMSPVIFQIWEGAGAIEVIRTMIGATDPKKALPGTIRGDWSIGIGRNLIHASESTEDAQKEIARFFKDNEIFSYNRLDNMAVYEDSER